MSQPNAGQTETWPEPQDPRGDHSVRLGRGQAVGRYLVLETVGDGGMGVVYSAYDPQLDRRVALKLLRSERFADRDLGTARLRLQREAQALARLAHPNVVTVFDVGALDDGQVFVAMEYVEGRDLRQWLKDERESASHRDIVDIFLQAGEGLAAAHRAGLLHRDFKPANVIVGADGRVRVADFGLARPSHRGEAPEEDLESSTPVIDVALTRPGRVPGTPAYMAPELRLAEEADARSDQFSFSVALYEALYGRLPSSGSARGQQAETPPRGHGVPPWLERSVLRGLSPEPGDRFESMEALLQGLRRHPRRRSAVLALVLSAGVGLFGWQATRAEPCSDPGRFRGLWDEARKSDLSRQFIASGEPMAVDWARRTGTILDRYTADWTEMATASCQATRRGEQSTALLDLRTACLDRRLDELRVLVGQLQDADGATVKRAVAAAGDLSPLASCADTRALLAVAPRPEDPVARGLIDNVEQLAITTRMNFLLGRGELAQAQADRLESAANQIDYPPALAEAHHARGLVASFADRKEEAREAQLEAAAYADAGGDDEQRVLSLMSLVWLSERPQALGWLRLARGALDRLDNDTLRASWFQTDAALRVRGGDYEGAADSARQAVELSRRTQGPNHRATGRVLATLGSALYRLGRYDEALETFAEVARIRRINLGPRHPDVAYASQARGEMLRSLGRYVEARGILSEALEILLEVHGEGHSRVATVRSSLGLTLYQLGEFDIAERELARVVEVRRQLLGPEAPKVAVELNRLSLVYWVRGELDAAEQLLQSAFKIHREAHREDHPETLGTRVNLGRILLEQGRGEEALEVLAGVLSSAAPLGEAHRTTVNAGLALGETYLALGQIQRGARLIAESAAPLDRSKAEPWLLGFTFFAEAQVAAALKDPATLATALEEARRVFTESGPAGQHFLSRLEHAERGWREAGLLPAP